MTKLTSLLWFVAAQVLLCLGILLVWHQLPLDDSYIFLTYARNLAATGQFAFNPGEVTYGFSSPAWVMVLAGGSRLLHLAVGVPLVDVVGIVMCGLAATAVWLLWAELDSLPSGRNLPLAAVLLSGPWFFSVWFLSGMETGMAVMALLGFLLWLAKLRAGAPRMPWMLVGLGATTLLALTRLEAGIYVGIAVVIALFTLKDRARRLELVLISAVAGCAEVGWLIYAKRTFGAPMPWTSTARIIFYLPGLFGLNGEQFYHLGLIGRSLIAGRAISRMFLGGPLKILMFVAPLTAAALVLLAGRGEAAAEFGQRAKLRWMLQIGVAGFLLEALVFAYMFPLVQNRHMAPYIMGIWVLVTPPILRALGSLGRPLRYAATAAIALVWMGGVVQYRSLGLALGELHQLAASGVLRPSDRVAAEPVGIISFETRAHIVDLGGLSDRSVWPFLMHWTHPDVRDLAGWEAEQGVTKTLIICETNSPGQHFGKYCVADGPAAASSSGPTRR